jgi:hypothetical protein
MGRADTDHFEQYLSEASVIQVATHSLGGGGHPSSFLAVLEGGVGLLAKPATSEESELMTRREVAAWRLALDLGWTDLVSTTVLREVLSPFTEESAQASAQVLWPASDVGVGVNPDEELPEEDVWRAAVFDALIRASDRHEWNWLLLPRDAGAGQRRLKLVDHGHAFDLNRQIEPGVSPFYLGRRGQQIPDFCLSALGGVDPRALENLLQDVEHKALVNRVEMLHEGTLDIQEP